MGQHHAPVDTLQVSSMAKLSSVFANPSAERALWNGSWSLISPLDESSWLEAKGFHGVLTRGSERLLPSRGIPHELEKADWHVVHWNQAGEPARQEVCKDR